MADAKSPIICVTCKREFPDDLKADDSPRYFAQYSLLPKSDEAFEFTSEAQNILRYMKAISSVWAFDNHKHVENDTYDTLFELMEGLSEEALRRVELSLDAYREIEKREMEAKKA